MLQFVQQNEEVVELKGEVDERAILDMQVYSPWYEFTGVTNTKRAEKREAEILEYLGERKNQYVSMETLQDIWEKTRCLAQ
ncbi:hypothetical protein [Bacillus sp. EB01]|uniref:hypothetical protein n=1 Tax=Bacillus sp. EB01 TaxID=1347086 RepID=UPI0005C74012|nr:hypothetical protein [Bacillus sp. EB01]